jgi:hypothetical protein
MPSRILLCIADGAELLKLRTTPSNPMGYSVEIARNPNTALKALERIRFNSLPVQSSPHGRSLPVLKGGNLARIGASRPTLSAAPFPSHFMFPPGRHR